MWYISHYFNVSLEYKYETIAKPYDSLLANDAKIIIVRITKWQQLVLCPYQKGKSMVPTKTDTNYHTLLLSPIYKRWMIKERYFKFNKLKPSLWSQISIWNDLFTDGFTDVSLSFKYCLHLITFHLFLISHTSDFLT